MASSLRRVAFLVLLAAGIGLASGGAAWLLLRLIGLVTNLALFNRVGWSVPSLSHLAASPRLVLMALLGAVVVTVIALWAPNVRGHGIPEAMEAVLARQSRMRPRTAVAKPLSIAIAIGTGAPFGAEGPIIVTGGALGSLLGQVVPVTPAERKILLASGAAGGTAAVFGTPIAAVVLVIELLLFEFSVRALLPILTAASIAGGVHVALFGSQPLFEVPAHEFSGLGQLWVFGLLGVACGLLSVVVCRGLFVVEAGYRRLPIGTFWHPLIGALGFALIGLVVPRALGTGYSSIEAVLSNRLAVGTLVVLLIAKLLAWWLALGSGTSGSILAPLLLISGSFGAAVGSLFDAALGVEVSVGAMALVAMAATFGASTGASLTGIAFAFELTRDYDSILPLMLASVLASLVAMMLLDQNLMTEKLTRRGIGVPQAYEPDVLRTTPVREAMSAPAAKITASTTIRDARRRVESGEHRAYPLVDENGRCVGIISRGDLLASSDAGGIEPVTAIASGDVVTVTPDDSMLTVLERMVAEGVDHLPVVSDGQLVGMCTRTDVLRVRGRHLDHERFQDGWKPTWLRAMRRT